MNSNNEYYKLLIESLEIMKADVEPGMVITEEMSTSYSIALIKAINVIKDRALKECS